MAELSQNHNAKIHENVALEFFHIFFHNLQAKSFRSNALRFQIRALPGPGKIGEDLEKKRFCSKILGALVTLPKKVIFLRSWRPPVSPTPYPIPCNRPGTVSAWKRGFLRKKILDALRQQCRMGNRW